MISRPLASILGTIAGGVVIVVVLLLIRGGGGVGIPGPGPIHVAVASNFADAIKDIARRFEGHTGHTVTLSFGATGRHYAQIMNGAPFEVFFAADAARPTLLESEGAALPGSRFTYAVGHIVLWSPSAGYVDSGGVVLGKGDYHHLALANPRLAPYGRAARDVLEALGQWDSLQDRIVRGENVSQTFQFVQSGAAELGFVAYSQVKRPGHAPAGSYWEVPRSLYTPIEQQAVLLKESPAARAFLDFVRGGEALEIIRGYGYGIP